MSLIVCIILAVRSIRLSKAKADGRKGYVEQAKYDDSDMKDLKRECLIGEREIKIEGLQKRVDYLKERSARLSCTLASRDNKIIRLEVQIAGLNAEVEKKISTSEIDQVVSSDKSNAITRTRDETMTER